VFPELADATAQTASSAPDRLQPRPTPAAHLSARSRWLQFQVKGCAHGRWSCFPIQVLHIGPLQHRIVADSEAVLSLLDAPCLHCWQRSHLVATMKVSCSSYSACLIPPALHLQALATTACRCALVTGRAAVSDRMLWLSVHRSPADAAARWTSSEAAHAALCNAQQQQVLTRPKPLVMSC
jgi:hypothetical protein